MLSSSLVILSFPQLHILKRSLHLDTRLFTYSFYLVSRARRSHSLRLFSGSRRSGLQNTNMDTAML